MTDANQGRHPIAGALEDERWFWDAGVYVVFDGQFGSTGKGLLSSVLAEHAGYRMGLITTNMGPNSGHTAYCGEEQIMVKQLPVSAVYNRLRGWSTQTFLNAGAVIDVVQLKREIAHFNMEGFVTVHPHAALIRPEFKGESQHIASTGQGVGVALINKLGRNESAVAESIKKPNGFGVWNRTQLIRDDVVFAEVGQGFSLGINSGLYPHVTTRECTPAQALSDLGLSPLHYRKSIVSLRLRPIRTGNLGDVSSGPGYPDQLEIDWEDIGQEPEFSTVTRRQRRLFEWSGVQYKTMLHCTRPDALFFNFCNYHPKTWRHEVSEHVRTYRYTLNRDPDFVLVGQGPRVEDVSLFNPIAA